MARKEQKITVISQVYVGDKVVPVSELNAEQRERMAIGLKVSYLNTLFAGQAVFSAPEGFEITMGDRIKVTRRGANQQIAACE